MSPSRGENKKNMKPPPRYYGTSTTKKTAEEPSDFGIPFLSAVGGGPVGSTMFSPSDINGKRIVKALKIENGWGFSIKKKKESPLCIYVHL